MNTTIVPEEYRSTRDAWVAAASGIEQLRNGTLVFLPAESAGWIDTGIVASAGQQITLLPFGKVWLSREADLAFGPNVALWYRIGDGVIARSAANSITLTAQATGSLCLIAKPPGEWASRAGDFLPDFPHVGATGGLLVAVLVWSGDIDAGLKAFAAKDATGIAAAELERRAHEKPLPQGWEALWRVGETSMFCEEVDSQGRSTITCRCVNDAAILKRPVDVPLDDTVRLDWSWRVTQLPSPLGEDTLATHDYLSIAIEFENGQDLTYLWSSCLSVGTAFRCPIAWWDQHETHIVRRTGTRELGNWIDESQPILADYRSSVGGPLPKRIVGIWLIGLSPFQRLVGECAYRAIRLAGSSSSVNILAKCR
jgi:hypothetical protein